MISNPPRLPDRPALGQWLRDVAFEINRRMWIVWLVPSVTDTNHGRYPSNQLAATESVFFSWAVPHQFGGMAQADVRLIPTTTGTLDWTMDGTFAAAGEDEALNTVTATADGVTATDDLLTAIDVTSVFATVDRNDSIGLQFTIDVLTTTTNVHVLGLYLRYFNA